MVKPLHRIPTLIVSCFSLLLLAANVFGAEFYVAPNGSSNGSGSFSSPWNLQTALNQPGAVHAGDTIWLRGGTYTGTHISYLNGTSSSPIIVRQYPGERAILDGGNSNGVTILVVGGSYTWFWGFEITSSYGSRTSSQPGPAPTDIFYGAAIDIYQADSHPGLKFINMIIHDTKAGFGWWTQATDSEIYGSVIYYNGWSGSDTGHGHGIYGQNQTGTKKAVDNIVFSQFGEGFQFYGSSAAYVNNIDLEGNSVFQNGLDGYSRNILVGGDGPTQNPKLLNNSLYYMSGAPTTALKLGLGSSYCQSPILTGNYVADPVTVYCNSMTITGNTFYGSIQGFSPSQFPNNTYYSSRPTGVKIFVRPNQYESGRAHITVYNWDGAANASVDLTGVLAPGTGFEIRNAQDFFGAPVLTGTYNGGSISIPVASLSVAAPRGWAAPPPTGPDFNVFVLLPASPGGTPTPTPATTATRTPTRTPTSAATATPTPGGGAGLGPPWQQQDIGAVGLAGSGSNSGGPFNVGASGTDIEDTSDQFHFVYQPWSGDGTIVARVTSIQNSNPWAKGGVMIRETLAANSKQAMTVLTPGNGVSFQRRTTTGGTTASTTVAGITAPYWVKVVRSGSTFTGYRSADGASWTLVGSDTITMAANVYVGLPLTSHNNSVLCASSIDNVSITSGASLVLPWQQQDIGTVGLAGNATLSGGTFNVSASGTDIQDTADQFHYVYQPWNGNGTVIARVTSIQNSNPWAKGGVMIRETLAADSKQAMTVLTPGNGVSFQRRKTTGGATTSTTVAGITAPYWVKVVRSGSTFTGYRSADGVSWTTVGSDTITMAANVYVGLPLTSHNNSVLCASSIDSVSITSGNSTILRLEAESPVLTSPMASVSDSTAFGGKYAVTTVANSGTGAWAFTAPVSGTYYIWCRIKTANPDQDSFFVKMDSGGEDIYDAAGGIWSGSWHWTRLNGRGGGGPLTINPRTFSLTAGAHTLTFRGREVQTKLDRVIITNDSTFVATEAP